MNLSKNIQRNIDNEGVLMKYEIIGDDMQTAVVDMNNGEFVQADAGSMFFMEGDIDMDLRMPGGWVGGLKRMFVGESFMLPVFKAKSDSCRIAFAPSYPAKILELEVGEGKTWQAQKRSFLFSIGAVSINVSFVKKFKVGFFGGEGFVLEKFTGDGKVFLNCGGIAIYKELAQDQKILVDTGCLVAFEEGVHYDIKMVRNLKTAIFGGEGLFLTELKGPGKIILQSLPFSRFANVITGGSTSSGPLTDVGRIFGGD